MTRKPKKAKITGNFTNVENLKSNFLKITKPRQESKESGNNAFASDAGYWQGGRCEWGGSHKLDEDAEVLANFFNSIANISEDINKIKLSANEEIFNSNKQQLISKLQGLISKCKITSSTSIGNVCCIWNDFFGNFLKIFLDGFDKKLKKQLTSIEKLEPKHQKELLDLESQARAAESAYKENLQKANSETDPVKKAEFIVLANKATQDAERIKQKIKVNPLVEVGNFSYLDDLKKLAKGNIPKEPPSGSGNPRDTNPNSGKENPGSVNQQYLLIFAGISLLIIFYLYTQNQEESNHYDYY
jgi:hypothetical protein